jgi:hypothetical protein
MHDRGFRHLPDQHFLINLSDAQKVSERVGLSQRPKTRMLEGDRILIERRTSFPVNQERDAPRSAVYCDKSHSRPTARDFLAGEFTSVASHLSAPSFRPTTSAAFLMLVQALQVAMIIHGVTPFTYV